MQIAGQGREWKAPLPPLTPELRIQLRILEKKRDRKGMKWCLAKGIGDLRMDFSLPPVNVRLVVDNEVPLLTHADTDMSVRVLLAETCHGCPFTKCRLHDV